MKRASILITSIAGLLLLALNTPAFAADSGKDKEVTITGEAKCAKCALKESDKCQTVIQTEAKNGKSMTYYLADNDVAKNFHETICKEPRKVTATGTIKKAEGKREFVATKIDVEAAK
jgi:hypothetical protein